MGMCFAVYGVFDATNAQKNEKLLFCVGSGLRARQSEIFEESASSHHRRAALRRSSRRVLSHHWDTPGDL